MTTPPVALVPAQVLVALVPQLDPRPIMPEGFTPHSGQQPLGVPIMPGWFCPPTGPLSGSRDG